MSIKLAFANDEFYQKKKTEITDNQHDRQPRKMIPVNAEVVIEVLLDITDVVFAHIENLLPVIAIKMQLFNHRQ